MQLRRFYTMPPEDLNPPLTEGLPVLGWGDPPRSTEDEPNIGVRGFTFADATLVNICSEGVQPVSLSLDPIEAAEALDKTEKDCTPPNTRLDLS